ncbi:MAG: PilZ domain-containing protein [Suilimivivens sp.]
MKLSELKEGTPVRIQAFKDGNNINDIWGKIRKNAKNQCQIDIYYYEGGNINLNSPEYEIHATAYDNGEHEIDWNNQKISGQEDERLVENRDAFRIYIGIPVECTVNNEETAALLVDLSEGGFRVVLREPRSFRVKSSVRIKIEDGNFNFSISGKIV